MFQTIFNDIKILIDNPDIKILEWFIDQDKTKGELVSTPAVYISFFPAKIERLTKHTEKVTINFDVIIYTDWLRDMTKIADSEHFEIENSIYNSLNRFEMTGWQPVEKGAKGILKSIMSYTNYYTQATAFSKNFQNVNSPASPNINISLD